MAPGGEGRIRLATGITTGWTRSGGPDGPPLLLLHAWAESRRAFSRFVPLLPPSACAVAIDLRGHGDADKPATGYDLASLTADVVAAMDALDLPRAVLVGASSGGYVAQQVAVSAPERVAGLVLAGSPHDLSGRVPFADEIEDLTDPVDPAWVRSFIAAFSDLTALPDGYVDLLVADALRMPADVWRATLAGLSRSRPPTEVGSITAPTLVVSGGRDSTLGPGQTAALVAAVPGARWIEYPDTGHAVLWERPERLAADVADFVASPR